MTQRLEVHPENPQQRLLLQAVSLLNNEGVVVFLTDSGYTLGCSVGSKDGVEAIRRIRQLDKTHLFTVLCRDLSEMSVYARVSNAHFRLIKAHTPGPYTFILTATKSVPKRLQHPNRKTIGIRVTDHPAAMGLLDALGAPLLTVSLFSSGQGELEEEALYEELECLDRSVDVLLDSGPALLSPTTVVDLTEERPIVLRYGVGDADSFE